MTYEEAGEVLLKESGVNIRKWRTEMSGNARYSDRSIVSPKPKTAKSFEVFAHEIGHIVSYDEQANKIKYIRDVPSWKKELEACQYSMKQFERFNLKLPREVKNKIYWYITYSVCQALNRGMKQVPQEVKKYTEGRINKVPRYAFEKKWHTDGSRSYNRVVKDYRYYALVKRKY